MDDGNRDAKGVQPRPVHCDAVFRSAQHLAKAAHLKEPRLEKPHLLFESFSKPAEMARVVGIHETRELDLVMVAAREVPELARCGGLAVQVEARDVSMICGAIVIDGRRSNQVFEVRHNACRDVTREVSADHIVRVGEAVWMLQ